MIRTPLLRGCERKCCNPTSHNVPSVLTGENTEHFPISLTRLHKLSHLLLIYCILSLPWAVSVQRGVSEVMCQTAALVPVFHSVLSARDMYRSTQQACGAEATAVIVWISIPVITSCLRPCRGWPLSWGQSAYQVLNGSGYVSQCVPVNRELLGQKVMFA